MAATTAPVMGFNGKAYYNAGSYGSPTWTLIGNMGDLKVTNEAAEADVDIRSGAGFTYYFAGMIKLGYEFNSIYDLSDSVIAALRTNYYARTPTEFLFMDQAYNTTGATGLRVMCQLFKFARVEELNKPFMYEIAVKPTYSANAPATYTAP